MTEASAILSAAWPGELISTLPRRYSLCGSVGPGVTLECARPCESQAHSWPKKEQERYQSILDRCDYETLVQHRYDRFCMMRRNRYMVDHAAHILTVYNGVPQGGTAQTLLYAIRKGLLVHPVPLEEET